MNISLWLRNVRGDSFKDFEKAAKPDHLYRFYEVGGEAWHDCDIFLEQFPVLKKTACGCWIQAYHKKKFVLSGARKRFACASLEEAAESFIARKKRQYSIYSYRTDLAKQAFEKMESLLKESK